jgi:EmrB/QacA subfamily drug resistance transporter
VSGSSGIAEAPALTPARKRWTLLAVILGSGIVFLDTSVVNLALPRIGEELSSDLFGTLEAQSYVANSYFVTLSALLILAGALSDYFGRRRMFAIGLIGFAATSLLCGIAPTIEFLIISRTLQGAAGALLIPGSLAIITATFQGEEQGRAFGLWAGASGATTILGPFVGGLLVNTVSWRMAFLINLPFLLIAYLATVRFVPESRDEQATGRFDWLGSLVVAAAVAGLAFGTIRGQQHGWSEPIAIVSLAIGAVAAIAFPLLMTRRRDPLVPPRLFRSRNFTVTNISTFVIYGALYVALTFLGIFMIGTLGYNEQAAGIAGVPSTLFLVLLSSRFGRLAARYGPRLFMSLGPAIMALGLLWLTRIPANSQGWVLGNDPAAGRLLHRPAPRAARVRDRAVHHGRPTHDRPDDLGPGAELRRGLSHQQRHIPGRLPTGERRDLRGRGGKLLRLHWPAGARRRHRLPRVPQRRGTAQPAASRRRARGPRRRPDGLDRGLPPRHAGRRRPHGGRRRCQRLGDPQPSTGRSASWTRRRADAPRVRVGDPQRSGAGWSRGVQEATTTGRSNRSRPTRLTTSLQLTASGHP